MAVSKKLRPMTGFLSNDDRIQAGDTVIVHIDFSNQLALVVDLKAAKGPVIQIKYGQIVIQDLIGLPYGSKYQCKKGFVYLLRATPELWTRTLPFRTQILYLPDISMIVLQLDLKPGSVVGESGILLGKRAFLDRLSGQVKISPPARTELFFDSFWYYFSNQNLVRVFSVVFFGLSVCDFFLYFPVLSQATCFFIFICFLPDFNSTC